MTAYDPVATVTTRVHLTQMKPLATGGWPRHASELVGLIGLLISLITAYLAVHSWHEMQKWPLKAQVGVLVLVLAGPLALWITSKRPLVALGVSFLQFWTVWHGLAR
jgi:hypothetical protein